MLHLLTGDRGSGKTTWLKELIERARVAHVELDGIITPAVFEDNRKTAIDCLFLPSHESMRLANWEDRPSTSKNAAVYQTAIKMPWVFQSDTIAAIEEHFSKITSDNPSRQLLIVDELGWMEFMENRGFVQAMRVLDEKDYQDAIVVIRPELLEAALARWEPCVGAQNIQVIEPNYFYAF